MSAPRWCSAPRRVAALAALGTASCLPFLSGPSAPPESGAPVPAARPDASEPPPPSRGTPDDWTYRKVCVAPSYRYEFCDEQEHDPEVVQDEALPPVGARPPPE